MALLPYDLDGLPERGLEELDAWRKLLDRGRTLPRAWAGRLRRDLEAEAVAASTAMEGIAVTVDEVRRILAGDKPPAVAQDDQELVRGYSEAMSFVLRRADDPAFQWNRELLVALHDRILAARYSEGAGRLREGPAYVVRRDTGEQVFEPPSWEQVPALIDQACAWMDGDWSHPAVASAWIHVAIAAIHPFRDGNGRVARVTASLAMYRGGFTIKEFTSLEEWWGRRIQDYYEAFTCLGDSFDPEADVTPFIRAHIEAQLNQVRALDVRERLQQQVWTVLEDVAADHRLPPRVANALWDAFFAREVSAGYYKGITDVSAPTATKDLAAGVVAGLLDPLGERRGRRYVATPQLYQEAAFYLGVDNLPDRREQALARIVKVVGDRLTWSGEAALGFERRPFAESG